MGLKRASANQKSVKCKLKVNGKANKNIMISPITSLTQVFQTNASFPPYLETDGGILDGIEIVIK